MTMRRHRRKARLPRTVNIVVATVIWASGNLGRHRRTATEAVGALLRHGIIIVAFFTGVKRSDDELKLQDAKEPVVVGRARRRKTGPNRCTA